MRNKLRYHRTVYWITYGKYGITELTIGIGTKGR